MRDVVIDRAVTSGTPRTTATAALVLAEQQGTPPDIEEWPSLNEAHAGTPAGIPPELVAPMLETFSGPVGPEALQLGGETVGSLADRVNPAVDQLLIDESWDTALVVLHGAVNRVILSRALVGNGLFLGHLAVNLTPYDTVPTGSRQTSVERIVEAVALPRTGTTASSR